MPKRTSKVIKDHEIVKYSTSLTPHDMQKTSFIMENFGEFGNKKKFNTYDLIEIPAGVFGKEGHKNKKPFVTTIGLFIFNRVFIEEDLMYIFNSMAEANHKHKEFIIKLDVGATINNMMTVNGVVAIMY